jgi:hypothetical protein
MRGGPPRGAYSFISTASDVTGFGELGRDIHGHLSFRSSR